MKFCDYQKWRSFFETDAYSSLENSGAFDGRYTQRKKTFFKKERYRKFDWKNTGSWVYSHSDSNLYKRSSHKGLSCSCSMKKIISKKADT